MAKLSEKQEAEIARREHLDSLTLEELITECLELDDKVAELQDEVKELNKSNGE